jgi:predicted RNA-binding protein with RPS1 domain
VGDEVQVRVLEVDPRRGRISLSMKDLPMDDVYIDEDEEELPTSMELALREAMEEQGVDLPSTKNARRRKKRSPQRRDKIQDDIISRTLRDHQS